MRQFNLLLFLYLLPLATMFAEEPKRIMEGLSMTSVLLGQDVNYSVVLPLDYYTTNRNYPVVYLLHCLGDN